MMIRNRAAAASTILLAMLALPGCFSLSRDSPPRQHYVLGSVLPAPEAAAPPVDAGLVGLRTPALADYLATPFMVIRRGNHRVEFDEFHRWGEDLPRGFSRALASHLSSRMPAQRVLVVPWPTGTHPEHLLQVQLLRFEGVAPDGAPGGTGSAHLVATWEILGSAGAVVLARGTTEVLDDGWVVGDFDALVQMLDAGIGTLAGEIAVELERVRATAAPAGLP